MKSFLDKLQPVTFEEELHHKSFLTTFAKFWGAVLKAVSKNSYNKRKRGWKRSQLFNSI